MGMLSFMAPSIFLYSAVLSLTDKETSLFLVHSIPLPIAFAWIVYRQITSHLLRTRRFWLDIRKSLSHSRNCRKAQIVNATALQSATFNLSRIAGPALAGLVIRLLRGDTRLALSFVVAAMYGISVFNANVSR